MTVWEGESGFARLGWVTFTLADVPAQERQHPEAEPLAVSSWILLKVSRGGGGEGSFTHLTAALNDLPHLKHLLFLDSSFWPREPEFHLLPPPTVRAQPRWLQSFFTP